MANRERHLPTEAPLVNLTVQQLAYLVAVADHETFSEAAASLSVTTSALSQGLATKLLRCWRMRNGLSLTPATSAGGSRRPNTVVLVACAWE